MSGVNKLDGFFETWVKKNSVIGEELSKTFNYSSAYKTLDDGLDTFTMGIYAHEGEGDTDWLWDESRNLLPNIRRVCTLAADLSGIKRFLKVHKSSEGQNFWKVFFKVKVFFGGTALKARLAWYEGVSVSHFDPQVTDIWLCLAGHLARRPCQRNSRFGLLDHTCFPSQEDGRLDPMNTFHFTSASPLDTVASVKQLTRGGVMLETESRSYAWI